MTDRYRSRFSNGFRQRVEQGSFDGSAPPLGVEVPACFVEPASGHERAHRAGAYCAGVIFWESANSAISGEGD